MDKVFLIISCASLIYSVESSAAPFITKCEADDDDCHLKSTLAAMPIFARGSPELNLGPLDPLVIENIDASSPNLEFKVTNAKVTGLKNCEPKQIKRDKDLKLHVEFLCTADLDSQYELKGKILQLFSFHGQGKLVCKLKKCLIKADINLAEKERDGKKHWSVKSWSHSFELQDKSYLNFENLVPFSKDLQTTVNDLIDVNSNDIIVEIGPNIIKAVVAKVVESVQHFLKKVPRDDLILS